MIVTNGIADKKGKPSIEFYKNRKPQYYCLGYENRMTDEPYKECMECPGWDLEEQCQKDYRDSRLNSDVWFYL